MAHKFTISIHWFTSLARGSNSRCFQNWTTAVVKGTAKREQVHELHCKLFQQDVTSLQMACCDKSDFNRLAAMP